MSNYTVRGNTTWVQSSIESTSDPRNGDQTTINGTATNQNDAVTQAVYYRNLGYSVALKQSGKADLWTVTATYNADLITDPNQVRIPDIQWEVIPNTIEKNIFECTERPFIANLSTGTKALIEAACKMGTKDGITPQLATTADIKAGQLPNATILYNLKTVGVDGKQFYTTTVKRSITVSTRFHVDWLLTYNDYVLSRNFLINTYNIPVWVASLMPNSDNTIQTDPSTKIDTFWGYLEGRPSYQGVARNRVTISQEWSYNKWTAGPNGLYDVVY